MRVLRQFLLYLWIDAAGNPEQIRFAVVVEVLYPRSPTHIPGLDAQSRPDCHILEALLPPVGVERRSIFGEMRLQYVEPPIQVEIANAQAHSGLLLPVF